MRRAYLARIDEVSWASLTHAHGAATRIADGLRTLATGSFRDAALTVGGMHGSICHQGSVYPATVPAIPILVDIALDPDAPVRAAVVELVARMAAAPFHFEDAASWLRDPQTAARLATEAGKVTEVACRAAVIDAAPRIAAGIVDAPPAVQIWMLSLLADLGEARSELAPAVEASVGGVVDDWARLALELYRAGASESHHAGAAELALSLEQRAVPVKRASDRKVLATSLGRVAAHLAGPGDLLDTAAILTGYAEQIVPIVFPPHWGDI